MSARGYFITGTDTGVGKTVITACLTVLFQNRGLRVGAIKPIETGVDPECRSSANSDAEFLQEVAGTDDATNAACLYRFRTPAAPMQASRSEGREIEPGPLLESIRNLRETRDVVLVEGIGGLLVPIFPGFCVADLARESGFPLLLVSRYAVGTLNHTALTVSEARRRDLEITGIILNHNENRPLDAVELGQKALIEELTGLPVLAECPFLQTVHPGVAARNRPVVRKNSLSV